MSFDAGIFNQQYLHNITPLDVGSTAPASQDHEARTKDRTPLGLLRQLTKPDGRKRNDKSQSRVPVTALMAWPRFDSQAGQNHRAPIRWQHRLNRERPNCTGANQSLHDGANGRVRPMDTS